MEAIHFTDYDKISDILMYFNKDITLKFNVSLSYTNKNNKRIPFHSEYSYSSSKGDGYLAQSVKRQITCYFSIDDSKNFDNNIIIRVQDIIFLRTLLINNVLPWIMGSRRIYGFDDDDKLIIKGTFNQADFPLNDQKFISFIPIVIDYNDNTSKEGIRMIINHRDNIIDMDINKFMEFYYFITDMDMYSVASSMLCYIKSAPYGENTYNMNNSDSYYKGNDFFKNLH